MKKFIIYILTIISYCHSQDLIINKNNFINNYKIALENFKSKDYEQAYITLYSLFLQKPDNLNINFYLGRSAYETKKYDEAIIAYEQFLFEKPNNNPIKLELARAYFMSKGYKESKKLLLEVKKDVNLPSPILLRVERYLALIDNNSKKNFLNGILIVGTLYDSNINNKAKYDIFKNIYFPAADTYIDVTNSTEDARNWYNQEILLFNHKYKIYDNITLKNDFLIFNKDSFNSQYDDTKLTLASYTPSISIRHTKKFIMDYALYTDFLSYAGKSKLKTFAIFPKFEYSYDSKNKISGYLKYQHKKDLQDDTQDKQYLEGRLNVLHALSKKMTLTSRVTVSDEKAKDTSQIGIDYTSLKAFISLNYKLLPTLSFTPNIIGSISKYHDIDANYLIKKTNKQLKMGLTSTYVFTKKWILQQSIDYTKQQSNIDLNEYSKYTFGLNLIRTF